MRFVFIISFLALVVQAIPSHAATPVTIDQSIDRGKQYLYSTINASGTWEHTQAPTQPPQGSVITLVSWDGAQWGLATCTATYGLLCTGEKPDDPRLKRAIAFCTESNLHGLYALGMQAQVLAKLPLSPPVRQAMHRVTNQLVGGAKIGSSDAGLWDYGIPQLLPAARYHHEPSGFGMLGLRALANAGAEVPDHFWESADKSWRKHQDADGGWSYENDGSTEPGNSQSQPAPSGAGVLALYTTDEFLKGNAGVNCSGNFHDPALEHGLKFIGSLNINPQTEIHWLYLIQQIATATAREQFGGMNWHAVLTDLLCRTQQADGSWVDSIMKTPQPGDKAVGAGFSLAMLGYGRSPLVINKLIHKTAAGEQANWNQRPRDIANITQWMGHQMEQQLQWQAVDLTTSDESLFGSPILFVAGNEALVLSAQDKGRLKTYVEQGGTIVGNADCANAKFIDSFTALGKELCPDEEFTELKPTDPILTDYQFPIPADKAKLPVKLIGNGVRPWLILFPTDAARTWQTASFRTNAETNEFFLNLLESVTDPKLPQRRSLQYYVPRDTRVQPRREIKLARIKVNAAWDPEPGAWVNLKNVLANQNATTLTTNVVPLGDGQLDVKKTPLAYLSIAGPDNLTTPQRNELTMFVKDGGRLFVEAAGGADATAAALKQDLQTIAGTDGTTLPLMDALFQKPRPISKIHYRAGARKATGAKTDPQIVGYTVNGKTDVYFSDLDLTEGLLGYPASSVAGYAPETATSIVVNFILQ